MSAVASDFNLTKINTKELSDVLRSTIEYGGNVFVLGRRGSSKTFQAKRSVREMGCIEVYINASTCERTDTSGFPLLFSAQASDYIKYALPHYYKPLCEGDKPCVVIFDELDKVNSDVIAPLLEFFQFHTINGRALPNLRACISTGNFIAEGGQRPPLPLLDRSEKFLVEVNVNHWLDWANDKEARIHPSITAFISDHPDCLYGEVDAGDLYADESPRGWHNASNILNFGEEKRWPNKLLTLKVAGCVGKRSGIRYSAYFDHYQIILPIIDKIMKGESVKGFDALEPGRKVVCAMVACSRLARDLDKMKKKGEFPGSVKTVGKFLKGIDPEIALISFRSQVGLNRTLDTSLDEEPMFDQMLKDISKRING